MIQKYVGEYNELSNGLIKRITVEMEMDVRCNLDVNYKEIF